MKKIPTAEEFVMEKPFSISSIHQSMIEFAKLHVDAALKAASIKVMVRTSTTYPDGAEMNIIQYVDENSILKAYPLENIK